MSYYPRNIYNNPIFTVLPQVDYYGFNYALSLRGKGCVIKSCFTWEVDGEEMMKPVSSIFLGLSPELELAIYTICALIRYGSTRNGTQ